jgi:Novel toxin 10
MGKPFNRSMTGFIEGGHTARGAKEFVIPNYRLDQLGI